jgi:hypothetical protein
MVSLPAASLRHPSAPRARGLGGSRILLGGRNPSGGWTSRGDRWPCEQGRRARLGRTSRAAEATDGPAPLPLRPCRLVPWRPGPCLLASLRPAAGGPCGLAPWPLRPTPGPLAPGDRRPFTNYAGTSQLSSSHSPFSIFSIIQFQTAIPNANYILSQ